MELKSYNQALVRLTKQSLDLEPSRKNHSLTACPNFKAVQKHARSLFYTLKSGLKCSCEDHAVKLRLENRIHSGESEDTRSIPFRLIFMCDINARSRLGTRLWDWKEVDIRGIAEKLVRVPGYKLQFDILKLWGPITLPTLGFC